MTDNIERLVRVEAGLGHLREGQEEAKERSHKFANALQGIQVQLARQADKLEDLGSLLQKVDVRDRVRVLEDADADRNIIEKARADRWQKRKTAIWRGVMAFATAIVSGIFGGDQIARLFAWIGSHLK